MYFNMVDRINEETSGGMVGVATTQGNPSVDYLPGGFTSMRNMLKSLSPVKTQWGLEVLDEKEKDQYRIKFENALDVIVPKKVYNEFNTRVLNVLNKSKIDLKEMLNEDVAQAVAANLKKINYTLRNIKRVPQVYQMVVLLETWRRLFPKSNFTPKKDNILLGLDSYSADVTATLEYITKLYSEDLGKLEGLTHALSTSKPLNTFPPFSDNEYLIGGEIQTNYQGVELTLSLNLDSSYHAIQAIHVGDPQVLDGLHAIKTLSISSDSLIPATGQLTVKDLNLVKKVVDDIVTEAAKVKPAPTKVTPKDAKPS